MRRTLLSLAMAAALLFPAATSRPVAGDTAGCVALVAALVYFTGPVLLGVPFSPNSPCITPFGAASSCGITQVGANASNGGNGHSYDYVMVDSCGNAHVQAGYDVTTQDGKERIDANGRTIQVIWNCTSDPWIAPPGPVPTCSNLSASSTGDVPNDVINQVSTAAYPLSAGAISDISHQALNGQLQNAIKQLQAQAQTNTQPSGRVVTTGEVNPQQDECPNGQHDPQLVNGWPKLDLCSGGNWGHWLLIALRFLMNQPAGLIGADYFYFSPRLVAAVTQWDQAHGVPADGTVGPVEWRGLIVDVQNGSQGNAVEAVQALLKGSGEDVVEDGDFGRQTDVAVRDYQTKHNLSVDGVVGPQTWQALLSGP